MRSQSPLAIFPKNFLIYEYSAQCEEVPYFRIVG